LRKETGEQGAGRDKALSMSPAEPSVSARSFDFTGYGFAIAGAVLFSTKGIFIKLAYAAGVGAETILALRMVVALPVYVLIAAVLLMREADLRAKVSLRAVLMSASVGILGYYVAAMLDFSGLAFVTAQYERLVLFTYPFFTLAFGVLLFGDRMNWRVVPALILSYGGLLVLFAWNLVANPDGLVLGTALILASAVVFALYQHLARRPMAIIGSRLYTCIGMGSAGLASILHNTIQHGAGSYSDLTQEVWIYGLCLGTFGTVLPSFFLNGAIHRIGARATSSTGAFGPVATIFLAVLVLGETFTLYHAVGASLVVGGAALFGRAEARQ
jgi:drug/metabolite transporter (DMT)-like permease